MKSWHQILENGVEACHLSSAKSNKSAIAISIGCGHFDDPDDCQGLTHLLEHMLFMGSKRSPQANSMLKRIEELGGSLNAFTSSEQMTIQCQSPNDSFENVFEAIIEMITSPLIRVEDVETEIETIDAEFRFKHQDDLRRLYDVHKSTCNREHPFSQFSVGNKAVFSSVSSTCLRQRLIEHHKRFFVGSNIKICIIGEHFSETFRASTLRQLKGLKNADSVVKKALPPLYLEQHLGVQISIVPLIDAKRLILTFPLPALSIDNRRSLSLISHLIGDENHGSILHLLKSKGWVTNLSAGGGIEGINFKDFNINMQLTDEAEKHIDDIIHTVLTYIKLLNDPEPAAWRLEEKFQLDQLYSEPNLLSSSSETAASFADGMHQYKLDDLLTLETAPKLSNRIDVNTLLKLFCLENLRIKYISKNITSKFLSKWYSTPYDIQPISGVQIAHWQQTSNTYIDLSKLNLPRPNPYISGHSERRVKTIDWQIPVKFWEESNAELWLSGAPMFEQRTADCYVSFECPANSKGTKVLAAKKLWLACLNDVIQSRYYAAEIAGLNYRLYGHQGGFSIHTSGFGVKQGQLIEELIEHTLQQVDFSKWFQINKESLSNGLKNQLLNKPVNRLFTRLGVLMQKHSHSPQNVLEQLQSLSLTDMLNTRELILEKFSVQGLMHGHWRKDDAHSLANLFDTIRYSDNNISAIDREVAKLTPQYTYFHEVESSQPESAALLFLQAPSSDPINIALTMIFEQLLATPFFDVLRTKKQLGYIVGSGFVAHNAHPGMVFYIQSPNADANTLIQEMTQFLISQLEHIDYYRQFWRKIQNNILRQLLAPDINTAARAQRLWMGLGLRDFKFNRNKLIAEKIQHFEFEDLIVHATALQQRLTFGELVLFSHGKFSPNETFLMRSNARKIDSVNHFKETVPYAE